VGLLDAHSQPIIGPPVILFCIQSFVFVRSFSVSFSIEPDFFFILTHELISRII